MGRRGCASAMGMIKFPSSCSSSKALCNQFIDYYICSRGVFCINHIKLRNFVVITIECSIATVDRGSIMTRIYRWSMMVYSSLQAEFMVTKYDGHIHRYGALKLGLFAFSASVVESFWPQFSESDITFSLPKKWSRFWIRFPCQHINPLYASRQNYDLDHIHLFISFYQETHMLFTQDYWRLSLKIKQNTSMDIVFHPRYQIHSKYICMNFITMVIKEVGHWM